MAGLPVAPPVPPSNISGIAMLGPVQQADVAVLGVNGVLATGTTSADGSFGPLSFSGTYNGPLRIIVKGTASSTWTCDFRPGCPANGQIQAFGAEMTFDGNLEAVLPSAGASQFVTVSLLSHLASARAEFLGGLTSGNVDLANDDIVSLIRTVMLDTFTSLSIDIESDFATIELFDISNPPAAGGADDPIRALLSLFNSGLVALANPNDTTGTFLDFIGK